MGQINLTTKEKEVLRLLNNSRAMDLDALCNEYYGPGRPKPKHFRGSMRKCVDVLALKCRLLGLGEIDKAAVRGRAGRTAYAFNKRG